MFQFQHLISRFNNSLVHQDRQRVYNELKSQRLLGRVFTSTEQELLREALFATYEGKFWHERLPFNACLHSSVEEARVDWFINSFLNGRQTQDYGRIRKIKARQLYELLRELDGRAWYLNKAPAGEFSLGLLPCSWLTLTRLHQSFREATCLEDLRRKTEDDYKKIGIRNPARRDLLEFVSAKLPSQAPMLAN